MMYPVASSPGYKVRRLKAIEPPDGSMRVMRPRARSMHNVRHGCDIVGIDVQGIIDGQGCIP